VKINYLEGFSGYCGFGLGLLQSGFEFNKHWYSEIGKYAIANTRYNFPNAIYAGPIQDVSSTIGNECIDLFTFGWPCQDNSIAGKRKGQISDTQRYKLCGNGVSKPVITAIGTKLIKTYEE
jgi:site-specific DNA-cytosine methylase